MKNILRKSNFGFTKWCVGLRASLLLALTLGWMGAASSQAAILFTEDFTFSGLLNANGWTVTSGTTSLITTQAITGLTYSGHSGSGVGNAAAFVATGEDVQKSFTAQTSGTVYGSALINISAAQSGDYFFSINNSSSSFVARLYAKSSGSGYVLGIGKSSSTVVYETTVRSFNATYLVVLKYAFLASTLDDTVSLFVDPALGGSEGSALLSTGATIADIASLGFAMVRQGDSVKAPTGRIDAIRVGTSWADVTASAVVAPTVTTSASISAISSSGATLGGSISNTGGANATETGIYYSTTTGFLNGTGTKVSATGLNQGTGAFTQIVTGLSQNTTYYFKAFAANSASSGYGTEQSFITTAQAEVPPSVTASLSATVDGNIEMTFSPDNASYRGAITDIKVGGTSLPAGAFSTLSAGKIVLSPSASSLLQSSGSKIITITATGYEPLNVTQAISHGVATKLGILTQAVAPTTNGGAFASQPVVAVQDQYGNTVLTSTETVTAAVGTGDWILGGTVGVAAVNGVVNFIGLTVGKVGTLTGGTISFTSGTLTGATTAGFNLPLPVLTITTSNSYNEGVSGQIGTVSIPFVAPADITVTLASSSVADFKVDGNGNGYVASTTVVIASGTSSSEFFLDVPADNTIDANASVTLTATATDFTDGTKAITVVNVDYVVPTIVINKVLNDSPVDTVEILVVGNGTPGSTVNLQGVILKDYSSNAGSDGGGSYTFVTSATWASVKAGTLIVLSNQAVGTEDLDGSDFLIRANLQNTTLFNSVGTFNVGGTEMVQIKASGSAVAGSVGAIHSFAFGSTAAAQITAAPMPKLVNQISGNLQVASNSNSTLADFNGSGITLLTVTPTTGIPHNTQNAAFVDSLRGVKSLSVAIAPESAILDETSSQQVNAVTVSISSPAASNLTVNLSATPSGAVTLPGSVVIPSGSSSAQVSFTPINDTIIAGNRAVTITANASGYEPGSNQFTLVDVQFASPSIVINELVNGGTGGSDSVELLVTQDKLNAVGMIFKDFSGSMGGDGGRQFTFTNVPLWQSLPSGTLIVLSTDATMVEDTDASDFLVKIQFTNTTYFTGSGGSSLDISTTDMVMVKASGSGTTGIAGGIHTFGSGTPGSNFKLANGAKLLFAAGGAGGGADNGTSAIVDYNGTGVTGGTATLGAANNANNQTYITALRDSAGPIAPSSLSYTPSSISGTVGVAISSLTPTVTGTVDTYSVSPTLPSGLSINATSGVISGTPTAIAASATYTVTAANAGGNTTATVTVVVAKGTPSITAVPLASAITVGQALSDSVLSGGTASVEGTFAWTTLSTEPGVGTASYGVTFTPTDTVNYNTFTTTVSLTVNSAGTTYSGWLGAASPSDAAFLDYVFGAATPGTLDPSLKPTVAITAGNLVLTYYVRQGTVGLTVTPKASADLALGSAGWSAAFVDNTADVPITVNGVSVQRHTASVPVFGLRKFLRIEAVQQ